MCNSQNQCASPPVQSFAIYGNYRGGALTLNIDQDIPGLAIGLVSYNAMSVSITGEFAANVVAVFHAGYDPGTTVSGVPASRFFEALRMTPTVADSGPPILICESGTAACNPARQVESFFSDLLGGTLLHHACQYDEFAGPRKLTDGGTCQ